MWKFSTQVSFILPLLISVAFITLFERKILSYSQLRKGPNKVSLIGVLQPMADAVKLFMKEVVLVFPSNTLVFTAGPMMGMALALILLALIPGSFSLKATHLGLMILVIMSLNTYPTFLEGWSSYSQYSFLGAVRGIAQTISYEISLALILFTLFLFSEKLNLSSAQETLLANPLLLLPIIFLLLISAIAETNRSPFDFAEGESELVSGFNTEYGGGLFALIFMAEYGMIIFFCLFIATLLFQKSLLSCPVLMMALMNMYFWMWLRATYPRLRYDKLLMFAWKGMLPLTITFIPVFAIAFI